MSCEEAFLVAICVIPLLSVFVAWFVRMLELQTREK